MWLTYLTWLMQLQYLRKLITTSAMFTRAVYVGEGVWPLCNKWLADPYSEVQNG